MDAAAPKRPAPAFLASLGAGSKPALKATTTKGGSVDLAHMLATEHSRGEEEKTREYFFSSGIDSWVEKAASETFKTAMVPIEEAEARAIIKHWREVKSKESILEDGSEGVPAEVLPLAAKIEEAMRTSFSKEVNETGFFVKLSTRSPKDSHTVFRKAAAAFGKRVAAKGGKLSAEATETAEDNARLIAFSEENVRACVVRSGEEAIRILCDSYRVAEDLMYAFDEGEKAVSVSVIIRAYDSRILPHTEFRAFVWGGRLSCVGQYWHSLYYPQLEAQREDIIRDCQALFERIKGALPVPQAMLDIAWLGPGKETILIEVNPLAEGLGSFKGSTGLFDYEEPTLRGEAPFELRLRSKPETRAELVTHMAQAWRKVTLGC